MNPKEVPEESARQMRCPQCATRRGYPCRSNALSRAGKNRTKERACMARRRAWLARNESESETNDRVE